MRRLRFIQHITHLNSAKVILTTIVVLFALLFSSCSAVATVFMQDDSFVNDLEGIESEVRTETPLSGGQITIPMPTNLTTFNPLRVKNINMANIYTLIFESPLMIDIDGRIRAELVENWSVDSTGMIWTFNLRKDIQWHNGFGELTADDIVFTLDLIMDHEPETSIYARYNKRIGDYYAQDKYTFVLYSLDPATKYNDEAIPKPSANIEYMMTFPVLCKAYYETAENVDSRWPIGTGPYEFTSYEEETGIRMDVNDDWWKIKPYISSIMAKPIKDAASEVLAYNLQQLDLVGTSDLSANRYRKYGVTNVEEYMTQYYDCLIPNLYVPKNGEIKFVHDIRGRQAIAYALNKSQIISKVLVNHAVATDVPIPPDSWLFDSTLSIYEHNEKEAIRLIEEMGYTKFDEEGFRAKVNDETEELETLVIELMYPKEIEDSYKQNIASLIEEQLENIGMRIDLRELPKKKYESSVDAGNFDLALVSFYIDRNPNPRFMISSSGTANYGYYKDEFMDLALEDCGTALKEEDRKIAYSRVQEMFLNQLPQISLYYRTNSLIFDDSIKGVMNYRALDIFNEIQSWYVISEVH